MSIDFKYLAVLAIPIIGGVIWLSKNDTTNISPVNTEPLGTGSLAPRNGPPEKFLTEGFDHNATQQLTVDDLFDGGTRKRQTKKNKKRKTTKRKTKRKTK